MTRASREKAICFATFLVCVAMNLGFSRVGWSHGLREAHEFRQTQTALAARFIQKEGWSLAGPLPLFGPPWSAPMEFPLYQTCVAQVSTWTGLPLEQTGRFVSLVFLYLSLPALFLLLRLLSIPPHRRWLFLGLLLVTPVYLYYSRSFMIESAALCCAAWFLHAYARALETRHAGWIVAGAFLGAMAGLIKITTFAVFLCPAFALMVYQLWLSRPERGQPRQAQWSIAGVVLAMTIPAIGIALAWVAFGDSVKNSNPLSQFLTSRNLREWNFGTLAMRVDPKFWLSVWQQGSMCVLHVVGIALFVFLGLTKGRTARTRIAVLIGCFLAGPVVFSNLYWLHDYYFYATGVFLVAAVALLWNELLDSPTLPRFVPWAAIVLTMGSQVFGFSRTYYHAQTRDDLPQTELGRVLRRITDPDDILVLHGLAWNPAVAYASDRKAIMVNDDLAQDPKAIDEVLRRVPPQSVGAMVVVGPLRLDETFLQNSTAKLDLNPQPILRNDTTDVYLARRLMPRAESEIENLSLSSLTPTTPPFAEINGVKVRRYRFDPAVEIPEVAMFSPRPREILAPFGIATAIADGARVFNAHAPTSVKIAVPKLSRILKADYGVTFNAYSGEEKTDGVIFRILLIDEEGAESVLYEVFLQPAHQPSHRGLQHLQLELPAGVTGDLVLRTLAGPANNITYDWAYWASVEIR